MKVLAITNATAPDKLGGLERYVRELCDELVRLGADVTIIAKKINPTDPLAETFGSGVRVLRYRVPSKRNPLFAPLYPLVVAINVRRLVRQEYTEASPTVCHLHYPVPALAFLGSTIPYVYTFHAPVHKEILSERQGGYPLPRVAQSLAVGLFKKLEGIVLRRARRVVTLSDFIAQEAAGLGVRLDRTIRIPGGIDLDRFKPDPAGRVHRIGGPPLLVTARRLVERTGVEELVRAMPIIAASVPGVRLQIAGDGTRRRAIVGLIERLNLTGSVELLGRISDDELVELYRRADIAVTPTQELEGFGLSTAEALACGTPAVVTPVGANPEVVAKLGEDLISKSRSPEDIAAAVVQLVLDSERVAMIRKGARDQVSPAMSWGSVASRYMSVYDAGLLDRPSTRLRDS